MTEPKARSPTNKPCRWHMIQLYAESEDYNATAILDVLVQSDLECVYVLHDRDVHDDTTDSHTAGDIKKAHYHVLVYSPAKMTAQALADGLGIDTRWCKKADGLDYCVYMLHIGYLRKAQYRYDELHGTERLLERAVRRCVNAKRGLSGGCGENLTEVYQLVTEWLDTQNNVTIRMLTDWACEADILGHVMQRMSVFARLVDEHNYMIAGNNVRQAESAVEKQTKTLGKRIAELDRDINRAHVYLNVLEMQILGRTEKK